VHVNTVLFTTITGAVNSHFIYFHFCFVVVYPIIIHLSVCA
jgi:hypothetical protein